MDFSFKKKYGQNFIIDNNIIDSIVNKAFLDKNSLVIEIGPGSGALTSKLSQIVDNVIAYEIDETLKPYLDKLPKNVEIIYGDFLKRDVLNDLKKYHFNKLYVVANLPYYITTPIIMKIIEDKILVDKMVVMVQKEVGNRFKAKPDTKDYNSLSVFLSYYFDIKKVMDVSRNVFVPKPNVDSIVVMFNRKDSLYLKDKDVFFKLVKDSFMYKRKTLKNNLKSYDLEKIQRVLSKHNLDLSIRAESLTLEQFIDIANEISN